MITEKIMEELRKRKVTSLDRGAFREMLSHVRLNAEDSKKILKEMQRKGLIEIRERQYIVVKKRNWVL